MTSLEIALTLTLIVGFWIASHWVNAWKCHAQDLENRIAKLHIDGVIDEAKRIVDNKSLDDLASDLAHRYAEPFPKQGDDHS